MKILLLVMTLVFVYSCSSKKTDEREPRLKEVDNSATIKRDYEVRDASSMKRPTWVENTRIWAEDSGKDKAGFTFFSYTTDPKVSREISCKLARANARVDIASEISTFIQQQLGQSQEGKASIDENNPVGRSLKEYVETTLAEHVQAMIHGASVREEYWEKRQYLEDLGAKKDFIAYTCSALIRISDKQLKKAIDKAEAGVLQNAGDPESKAKVRKALDGVEEKFIQSKKGLI